MAIVSTELEVQDITTLPKRTASGIDPDTDFVLGVEENGTAYKADIEDLGQSIVQGAKSNLLGRNQTVASAFRMLREETNEKIKQSYGAPLVATTILEMTDKKRVYVYTGDEGGMLTNRWYYWNGSEWQVGGLYYSGAIATDDSLSIDNVPADAKAVGDALDEVNTELSSITDNIEQLQEDSSSYAASTSIAPVYSTSGIYAVGDYCMHDGTLYRCTTAISTAEAWNASHWTADNVKNIADGLKDDVSDLKEDLNTLNTYGNNAALSGVKKQMMLSYGNVFNKMAAKAGVINSNGSISDSQSYYTSDFIPVQSGDVVKNNKSNNYTAFYDSAFSLVGSRITGQTSNTAPSNSAYFRVSFANSAVDSAMVYINIDVPSDFYGYGDGPEIKLDAISKDAQYENNKKIDFSVLKQIQHTIGGSIETAAIEMLPEIVNQKYIDTSNKLHTVSSDLYKVKIYDVFEGQTIKLYGDDVNLSDNYPLVCFFTNLSEAGILIITGSSTPTDYSQNYTAPTNGYIVVAIHTNYKQLYVYNVTDAVDDALLKRVEAIEGNPVYIKTDTEIQSSYTIDGAYINTSGGITTGQSSTFKVYQFPVVRTKSYYITGTANLRVNDYPIAGFKTSSGASGTCEVFLTGKTTSQNYHYLFTPSEDGYIFIAWVQNSDLLGVFEAIKSNQAIEARKSVVNPWYGKKVVWIGTSVPFGANATKSYAQEIANYLGFNLVNCSVPGLAIELDDGQIKQYGSLTASKSEYAAAGWTIPDAPIIPYVPGGSYNNYYRTWENVFSSANADADLYVFDVAPNNSDFTTTDWDAFDKSTWAYNNSSSFADHRNTFIGALLFLMDKMYELNPNARMVFFLGSAFAYANGKTAFERLATQWNIGIIDVWSKINTSPKSLLKIKSLNGTDTHPSTFAHEMMGKMLVGEFNRFA